MSAPRDPDVLVVGGGIIGLACARELARQGRRVELVERGLPGGAASGAGAGMLAVLTEIGDTEPFFEVCRDARDLWGPWLAEIVEESGLAVEYDRSGALVTAADEAEDEILDGMAAAGLRLGEPVEEIPVGDALRLVPDLTPATRRALHLPGEHRVNNVEACAALRRAAERARVRVSSGRAVQRVEHAGGVWTVTGEGWRRSADLLVVTAGCWSGGISGLPELPVRPVRGQMVRIDGVSWPWQGQVRVCGNRYGVRRGDSGLLFGATVEEAGFACRTTVEGVGRLLDDLRRGLPGLAGRAISTAWAGLRPGTPDKRPIVGRLDAPAALVATGHYRNGILLAPWTARVIAALARDEPPPPEAELFSPRRFGVTATAERLHPV